MTHLEFLSALANNSTLYIFVIGLTIAALALIVRRTVVGIFDPMIFVCITAAIDAGAAVVLAEVDAIAFTTALVCLTSTLVFFLAATWSQRTINRTKQLSALVSMPFLNRSAVAAISACAWAALLVVKYTWWDIPLFNETSRLADYFAGSSTAYSAITSSCSTLGIVVVLVALRPSNGHRRARTWRWLVVSVYFIDAVLAGSKFGAVISLGAIWQIAHYRPNAASLLNVKNIPVARLAIMGFVVFSLVATMRYDANTIESIGDLFSTRAIQTSDTFFLASDGQEFLAEKDGLGGFMAIALPSVYGFFGGSTNAESYGQMIFGATMGFSHLEAPNARMVVVLVATLGVWAIAMAAVLGAATGAFRVIPTKNRSVLCAPLFLWAPSIFTDLPYALGRLKWILLTLVIIILLSSLFRRARRVRHIRPSHQDLLRLPPSHAELGIGRAPSVGDNQNK